MLLLLLNFTGHFDLFLTSLTRLSQCVLITIFLLLSSTKVMYVSSKLLMPPSVGQALAFSNAHLPTPSASIVLVRVLFHPQSKFIFLLQILPSHLCQEAAKKLPVTWLMRTQLSMLINSISLFPLPLSLVASSMIFCLMLQLGRHCLSALLLL